MPAGSRVDENMLGPRWRNLTTNKNVKAFNQEAKAVVQRYGWEVLDAYTLSEHPVFSKYMADSVHMGRTWYHCLSEIIMHHMCHEAES